MLALAAFAFGFWSTVARPLRLRAAGSRRLPVIRSPHRLPLAVPSLAPADTQVNGARRRAQAHPAAALAVPPTPARAAIIIDDCGNNWKYAAGFVHAPAPLTLSILPYLPYSSFIAQQAHAAGKGVILHFPLEADAGIDPGPGTLRVAMSDHDKEDLIRRNLAAVPDIDGVNNHEGSRATADERVMALLLAAVKQRGLFYVDSLTTPHSCAPEVAARLALRFAQRDLFLDNDPNIDAIKDQMRQLMVDARAHGEAIGIGHVRPDMLTAFDEMVPAFEEAGVRLVLARDLHLLQAPYGARPGRRDRQVGRVERAIP